MAFVVAGPGVQEADAQDPLPNLLLEITDSADPVEPGKALTYIVRVTNQSEVPAGEVVVTHSIPTRLIEAKTDGCAESPAAGPKCTLSDLEPGQEVVYEVAGTVEPGAPAGTMTLSGTVTSKRGDEKPDDNTASEQTTIITNNDPEIEIGKAIDRSRFGAVGESVAEEDERLAGWKFDIYLSPDSSLPDAGDRVRTFTTTNTTGAVGAGPDAGTGVTIGENQTVVVCERPQPGYSFDRISLNGAGSGAVDPAGLGRPCVSFTRTNSPISALPFVFMNDRDPEISIGKAIDRSGFGAVGEAVAQDDERLAGFEFDIYLSPNASLPDASQFVSTFTTTNTTPDVGVGPDAGTGVTMKRGETVVVCERPQPGYSFDRISLNGAGSGAADPAGEGRPCVSLTRSQGRAGGMPFVFMNDRDPEISIGKAIDRSGFGAVGEAVAQDDERLAGFEFDIYVSPNASLPDASQFVSTFTTTNTTPDVGVGPDAGTGVTMKRGETVVVCERPQPGYSFDRISLNGAGSGAADPAGEGRPCVSLTRSQGRAGGMPFVFMNDRDPEISIGKAIDRSGFGAIGEAVAQDDERLAGFEFDIYVSPNASLPDASQFVSTFTTTNTTPDVGVGPDAGTGVTMKRGETVVVCERPQPGYSFDRISLNGAGSGAADPAGEGRPCVSLTRSQGRAGGMPFVFMNDRDPEISIGKAIDRSGFGAIGEAVAQDDERLAGFEFDIYVSPNASLPDASQFVSTFTTTNTTPDVGVGPDAGTGVTMKRGETVVVCERPQPGYSFDRISLNGAGSGAADPAGEGRPCVSLTRSQGRAGGMPFVFMNDRDPEILIGKAIDRSGFGAVGEAVTDTDERLAGFEFDIYVSPNASLPDASQFVSTFTTTNTTPDVGVGPDAGTGVTMKRGETVVVCERPQPGYSFDRISLNGAGSGAADPAGEGRPCVSLTRSQGRAGGMPFVFMNDRDPEILIGKAIDADGAGSTGAVTADDERLAGFEFDIYLSPNASLPDASQFVSTFTTTNTTPDVGVGPDAGTGVTMKRGETVVVCERPQPAYTFDRISLNGAGSGAADPAGEGRPCVSLTRSQGRAGGMPFVFMNAPKPPSPPSFSKKFEPSVVLIGQVVRLTFTVDNTANSTPTTKLAFSDEFPEPMVVAPDPNISTSCGGTLANGAGDAVAGGDLGIRHKDGAVSAGSSCTITVDIVVTDDGIFENTSSVLESSKGNGRRARATLEVVAPKPLGFDKEFSPNSIGIGQTSTLSFTIDNTDSPVDATDISFTDNFPAGMTIASPPGLVSTCEGTIVAQPGSGTVSYTAGKVKGKDKCFFSLRVTASTVGTLVNTTNALTSSHGNSGTAQDTLTVDDQTFCAIGDVLVPTIVSQGECDALVALYVSTDGPNWDSDTGWNTATDPCDWQGITCNDVGVTVVSVTNNGLDGPLPTEIGDLGQLEVLNLKSNELSGEIPAEIGELANLERLYLHANELTGPIPADVGDLESLDRLYLYNNSLSGEIPIQLGNLAELSRMYLHKNELSGEIPGELGNLGRLSRLYLYDNELSGELPAGLGDFDRVKRLYLYNNDLSGEIPAELGGLDNLQYLYLYNNDLSGEIPPELGDLANLRRLYLHINQLDGEIPSELGALESLNRFYLHKNQLTGEIPTGFGEITGMTHFLVSRNALVGTVPADLGDLDDLTNLELSHNRLTGNLTGALAGLIDTLGKTRLADGSGLNDCFTANAAVSAFLDAANPDWDRCDGG